MKSVVPGFYSVAPTLCRVNSNNLKTRCEIAATALVVLVLSQALKTKMAAKSAAIFIHNHTYY